MERGAEFAGGGAEIALPKAHWSRNCESVWHLGLNDGDCGHHAVSFLQRFQGVSEGPSDPLTRGGTTLQGGIMTHLLRCTLVLLAFAIAPGAASAQCWTCTFATPPSCQTTESGGTSCWIEQTSQGPLCHTAGVCEDLEGFASPKLAALGDSSIPSVLFFDAVVKDCNGREVRRVLGSAGKQLAIQAYRTLELASQDEHATIAQSEKL